MGNILKRTKYAIYVYTRYTCIFKISMYFHQYKQYSIFIPTNLDAVALPGLVAEPGLQLGESAPHHADHLASVVS